MSETTSRPENKKRKKTTEVKSRHFLKSHGQEKSRRKAKVPKNDYQTEENPWLEVKQEKKAKVNKGKKKRTEENPKTNPKTNTETSTRIRSRVTSRVRRRRSTSAASNGDGKCRERRQLKKKSKTVHFLTKNGEERQFTAKG